MKKLIVVIVILIAAIAAGWYVFSTKGSNTNTEARSVAQAGDIVARVNGEAILSVDLEIIKAQLAAIQGVDIATAQADVKERLQTTALDTRIGQVLIQQEVTASGFVAPAKDVEERLAEIRSQFDTEEAFTAALAADGLTVDSLRTQVANDLAIQLYLEETLGITDVEVTDEEVRTSYAEAAAQAENVPAFEDVQDQIKAFILQQKQQGLLDDFVQKLRANAEIQVL
ncbi:hypothetical protein CL652_02325 [bacterium]|nr:hypothetical protein [bacterium]|tara:strand:+ start:12121 stop:12801 length:681 start_codon:yes stop_codon:yes gene_type:complete